MENYKVKITVECNWDTVTHIINWTSNIKKYKDVFKSILKFNWYKEDIIIKEIWY